MKVPKPRVLTQEEEATVDALVAYLLDLEKQQKEVESRIEEAKRSLKEILGEHEMMVTDNYVVRWTHVSSNRFDTTAFKSKYPGMYQDFCKLSESRRFSVSAQEE